MIEIYTITNTINGKRYVGQSKQVRRRWIEHRYRLNANRHPNIKLQRAWNKYGEHAFIFEVIKKAETRQEANAVEKECISKFNTCCEGYNITEGGELRNNLGIPCVWNGKQYQTLTEACKDNGMRYGTTLLARLKKGYTCDADLPCPVRGGHATPCEWNGVVYPSLSAAAMACGIRPSNMRKRLNKGYVRDSDVPPIGPVVKPCIWEGEYYPSISEAAKANSVSISKMGKLLRKKELNDERQC